VTDYDCWHPSHDEVTVKMIVANLQKNAVTAQRVISDVVARLSQVRTCKCGSALENAIITVEDEMPSATRAELEPIIGKYLKS
jgi:5'-methylthioadenosine phosphorylase